MRRVKFALPLILCLAFAMTACNTIENRRSVYAPKKADGPYTRSLNEGSWDDRKTVDEQYQESQRAHGSKRTTPPVAPPADS